jgi:hypothetical protein
MLLLRTGSRPRGRSIVAAGLAAALVTLAAAPALAQQGPLAAVASIEPTGGSGVNGSATFMDAGTRTVVTVRAGNLPPNSTRVNHIHAGICNGPDRGIAFPLADLRSDARGEATANTTVDVPLARILAEGHYVNIHAGASLPSPGVACGQIALTSGRLPLSPGAPGVRLPATGGGGPGSPVIPLAAGAAVVGGAVLGVLGRRRALAVAAPGRANTR